MSLTSDCAVCAKQIKESSEKVLCFGPCGLIMHLKCSDEIDKTGLRALETNRGLKFMCHSCRGNQISFNSVMEKCGKIMDKLTESIEKWENWRIEAVKKAEELGKWTKEVDDKIDYIGKTVTDNIRSEFDGALKTVMEAKEEEEKRKIDVMEKKIENCVKKNCQNRSAGPSANLRSRKKRRREEDDEDDESEKLPAPAQPQMSFADAVKSSAQKKKNPVIIIKPKEAEQTTKATKQELRSQIDRAANNISAVREGSGGAVILNVKTADNVETVLQTIKEKFGEKYQATVPKPKKPRLKIVGVEEKLDEIELRNCIADQNDLLVEMELKLVTHFSNENAAGDKTYSYIVEVDDKSHDSMQEVGRVNIGWERCRVVECFGIIRCKLLTFQRYP